RSVAPDADQALLRVLYWFPPAPVICLLSLHDALPIFGWLTISEPMLEHAAELHAFVAECQSEGFEHCVLCGMGGSSLGPEVIRRDRKSTRLNSSHQIISYAALCLKKKTARSAAASSSP